MEQLVLEFAKYIGCKVIHPRHGEYTLAGVMPAGIVCQRNKTGKTKDDECELFDFTEKPKLVLKPLSEITRIDVAQMLKHNIGYDISSDPQMIEDQYRIIRDGSSLSISMIDFKQVDFLRSKGFNVLAPEEIVL